MNLSTVNCIENEFTVNLTDEEARNKIPGNKPEIFSVTTKVEFSSDLFFDVIRREGFTDDFQNGEEAEKMQEAGMCLWRSTLLTLRNFLKGQRKKAQARPYRNQAASREV